MASEASLGFPADGATKTVTISGYTGTLRADRNDTWFTVSLSGGTISVTATKNTSTARAGYVDVTDTGSGRSVRIQVTQAAPIYNPEPSKAPTNTPTPTPAETLPVKTKKLEFGAQAGQDTLTLDGKGYNLAFSYPDNPSVPTGWVTMSYENGKIIVRVKQNKDYISRSMKVKITDTKTNRYAYVTISQKAAPKPTPTPTPFLTADRTEITCDSKGGEEYVTLKGVNGALGYDFSWEPNTVTDWVLVRPEGNRVVFSVSENWNIYPRTATITITDSKTKKAVSVTISQEATPNTAKVSSPLQVDKDSLVFECVEGNQEIKVSGKTGELRVDRVGNDKWITVAVNGNTVKVSVVDNTDSSAREGYLDITDTGNGQRIRVSVSQKTGLVNKVSFDYNCNADSTKTVIIRTTESISMEYEWIPADQRAWVSFQRDTIDIEKYWIKVDENTSYEPRTVRVKVSTSSGRYAYIVITQKGRVAPDLKASSRLVYFPIGGGKSEITVSNAVGDLSFQYGDGSTDDATLWMKVEKSGGNAFTITTKENDAGRYRDVFVCFTDSITGKKINVQVWQHSTAHFVDYIYEQDKTNGEVVEEHICRLQYQGEPYYSLPAPPTRNGYTFDGWYTERGIGNGYKIEEDVWFWEQKNISLYAHWTKNKKSEVVFDLNYEGCPNFAATLKIQEGKPFGKMPTPPERSGFDFSGWYTVPNAYSTSLLSSLQVSEETICKDDSLKVLYAHWQIKLLISELDFLGEKQSVCADEGCVAVIPNLILEMYEVLGFKVAGWTLQKDTNCKDNGNKNELLLPKNMVHSELSIWAVNEKGQRFEDYLIKSYGSVEVAKAFYQVKIIGGEGIKYILPQDVDDLFLGDDMAKIAGPLALYFTKGAVDAFNELSDEQRRMLMDYLSKHYYGSQNLLDNSSIIDEVEKELAASGGYYNGQGEGTKSQLRVGQMSFAEAGCGIIACYNALKNFKQPVDIIGLTREFEVGGYLMSAPNGSGFFMDDAKSKKTVKVGGLGPNPYKIGKVLGNHGLSTKQYTSRDTFLNTVLNAVNGGTNRKFIVAYWTSDTEKNPTAHYVFLETNVGSRPITIYNRHNKASGPSDASYGAFKDMMVSPKNGKNLFIVGYEIFG
jgi:uncharacterized repeat protein (TIGR02543 family)